MESLLRSALRKLKTRLSSARENVFPTMEIIRDIEGLDRKLHELDVAAMTSDDALRRKFTTFRMEPSFDVPKDPYSDEYRDRQFALYERIAGKKYSTANEVTKFPVKLV